MLHGNIGMKAV